MSAAGSRRGTSTVLSHENATNDERIFDWDDEIVNAAAYRRAMQHQMSKQDVSQTPRLHQGSGNPQLRIQTDDIADPRPETPFSSRPWESRPLPYENSVVSEPVEGGQPRKRTYFGIGSKSDIVVESPRGSPRAVKSPETGKKSFWSALTPKLGSRNLEPPAPTSRSNSSASKTGSYRGKRGFENSSSASIDFGSENGLSAPSIVRAAQAGSVVEVEMLLNQGVDVEAVHRQSGRNALAVASQYVVIQSYPMISSIPLYSHISMNTAEIMDAAVAMKAWCGSYCSVAPTSTRVM